MATAQTHGKRDLAKLEKRRLEAARLLAQGLRKAEVARRLGVSPMSVTRWAASMREHGKAGLRRADRLGRRSKLDAGELRELRSLVRAAAGSAAPTLPEMAERIRRRFGVRYHPGHVWRLLRKLGWRPRASRGRPPRRDPGWS